MKYVANFLAVTIGLAIGLFGNTAWETYKKYEAMRAQERFMLMSCYKTYGKPCEAVYRPIEEKKT